jgi:hypothetical protein
MFPVWVLEDHHGVVHVISVGFAFSVFLFVVLYYQALFAILDVLPISFKPNVVQRIRLKGAI